MALIDEKLVRIMQAVTAIGKNKRNSQQQFNYRGIDDVYNSCQALLAKEGVYCRSRIDHAEHTSYEAKKGGTLFNTKLTITYFFVAEDGSEKETQAVGEGMDSGDKSTSKAMSVAHKYAVLQTFMIPTEDMPDPDKDSHEVASNPSTITAVQVAQIKEKIKDCGVKLIDCYGWMNAKLDTESFDQLIPEHFDQLLRRIEIAGSIEALIRNTPKVTREEILNHIREKSNGEIANFFYCNEKSADRLVEIINNWESKQ